MKNPKVKAIRSQNNRTAEPGEEFSIAERGYNDFDRELMEESKKRQARLVNLGTESGKRKYSKTSEMLAQSDFAMKNEPIPHGMELFPAYNNLWFMRYANLYYPHAKGGAMYIDTPISRIEEKYCEQKLAAYRKAGVRYTYIKSGDDASDAAMRLDPPSLPTGPVEVKEETQN